MEWHRGQTQMQRLEDMARKCIQTIQTQPNLSEKQLQNCIEIVKKHTADMDKVLESMAISAQESRSVSRTNFQSRETQLKTLENAPRSIRHALRNAVVAYKKRMSESADQKRAQLINNAPERALESSNESKDDLYALRRSQELTKMLERTSLIIHSEVRRTGETHQTFLAGTESVQNTLRGMDELSDSVRGGRKAVTSLARREQTDKILFRIALFFFFLTVVYILYRRLGVRFLSLVPTKLWEIFSLTSNINKDEM